MTLFRKRSLALMVSTAALALLTTPHAFAQTTPTPAAAPEASADSTVVVVTGYKKSLLNATKAKQSSVSLTDSIFASDIGKFPDVNISESLQRIPGIQLQRNGFTGEGVTVSVRGLGPSFTSFSLNGAAFQVASNGDGWNTESNREVDLNLFPAELFTRLTVSKTPTASQLEGGVAGNVDLRTARAFDNKGTHLNYNIYENYNQVSGKWAPRAAIVASKTWDHWGLLAGVSYFSQNLRTDYYVPQDMTDVNLSSQTSDPQGPVAQLTGGSNGYVYPSTVPASYNGINGLVGGTPVTVAYLQSLNPGQTVAQITGALLPRLGTVQTSAIKTDRYTGVVSLEYRPTDTLRFALDVTGGGSKKVTVQRWLSWFVRNSGGMIPINQKVDANNVVTSGTYVGAVTSPGAGFIDDRLWFYNVNPEMKWTINDNWELNGKLNVTRSGFTEGSPSFLLQTSPSTVNVITYTNNGGVPSIKSSLDQNDPNVPRVWFAARLSAVKRVTENHGAHIDLVYRNGDEKLSMGVADDQNQRTSNGYNNDSNYTNYVNSAGSPLPSANLGQYVNSINADKFLSLIPGSNANPNFVVPDINRVMSTTNYSTFLASAPLQAGSGTFREKTQGVYIEYQNTYPVFGKDTTVDLGLRHVSTDQFVTGAGTVNGGLKYTTFTTKYNEDLPSINIVSKVANNINLRFAASKTITRANPAALLPAITLTDPGAASASGGNPNLKPYLSDNLDFGGEYYTGGLGYVGFDLFHKRIVNYTVPINTAVHLADLGLTMNDITLQQQAAINLQGGPTVASIQLSTTINSPSPVTFEGYELNWVQPLDQFVKGAGFTANYTNLATTAAIATLKPTNVPHYSYNVVGYYENYGLSVHLSYNFNSSLISAAPPQRNDALAIYQVARGQLDLSASYDVKIAGVDGEITLDATNLTKAPLKQYFGYANAADQTFNPGINVMVGWRGHY